MENERKYGLSHIYLDEGLENFSNVSVGLILRALGYGLKIAYIDSQNTANKFTNFLENLSLSYSFVKNFDKFVMDVFKFRKDDKVSRTFLPSVEFNTITSEIFWNSLNSYDLVIFDNFSSKRISKVKILDLLKSKSENTELVLITSENEVFDEVQDKFDLSTHYKYVGKNLFEKNKIINITGNGKGKSTYSFGYLIRNFIDKEDVKLVYFDKGGNFYGERVFFKSLKKWSRENHFYGTFDFVATGCVRFDGTNFRFENNFDDIREAKEGLMLLKTALKKQTPVIAEELNTTIKTKLLDLDSVLEVLKSVENQVVLTGRYSPKEIIDMSDLVIETNEIKHYSSSGHSVRAGIDY